MTRITPANQMMLLAVAGGLLAAWNLPLGLIVGFVWVAPIVVAIGLGESRDRTGWAWGLLLGWLGVLILAIMKPQS